MNKDEKNNRTQLQLPQTMLKTDILLYFSYYVNLIIESHLETNIKDALCRVFQTTTTALFRIP